MESTAVGRRDSAGTSVESGQPAAASSWKSKLSENQLKRKRVSDRRSHRESRNKAKETVAELEERLRLLAAPDKLILSLIESNAGLQAQRDNFQQLLNTCFTAFGFERGEGRDIMARVLRRRSDSTSSSARRSSFAAIHHPPSPCSSSPDSSWQRTQADTEIDSRMSGQYLRPSPFPRAGRRCDDGSQNMVMTDDQILAALPEARKAFEVDGTVSVFGLASELIYSNLAPSQIRDEEELQRIVRLPDFFYVMIAELLSCPVQMVKPAGAMYQHSLLDVISRKRREMVALAVESTRGLRYNSPAERVLMFWAVYRFLSLFVFPTPQNLARLPPWYKPVPAQLVHPHPNWVDFIPWPYLRDRLVHVFPDYQETDLMTNMISSIAVEGRWQSKATTLLKVNDEGTDLILDPGFQSAVYSVKNLTVKIKFLQVFPEFEAFVNVSSEDQEDTASAGLSNSGAQEREGSTQGWPVEMGQWIESCQQNMALDLSTCQDANQPLPEPLDTQTRPRDTVQDGALPGMQACTSISAHFLEEGFQYPRV